MPLSTVQYMRWAKALPRRPYALAASGVPVPGADVFDPQSVEIDLGAHDAYGLPSFVEAIAHRYDVPVERVLPLSGTSTANFIAVGCIVQRGARVLIEHPVYEPLVRAAEFFGFDAVPVPRDPEHRYRLDLRTLEAGLAAGAKAVVISDLHNPSGLLCPDEDLRAIVRLTRSYDARLVVDEVYRDYHSLHHEVPPTTAALLGDHVIVTSSLSKVYGLGGLRAGWMLAAPEIIARAQDMLDHMCVVNPLPSQQLAVAAFEQIGLLAERTRRIYRSGYPVYHEWLSTREDVLGYGNDGAVFEFPRIAGIDDTGPLCQLLVDAYETSIVPGAFFGAPEHVRISFTLPPDALAEGLKRVGRALDRMRRET